MGGISVNKDSKHSTVERACVAHFISLATLLPASITPFTSLLTLTSFRNK
jgi:hypothetical protein